MQIRDYQIRRKGGWGMITKWVQIFLQGDEKVLKLERAGGCTKF